MARLLVRLRLARRVVGVALIGTGTTPAAATLLEVMVDQSTLAYGNGPPAHRGEKQLTRARDFAAYVQCRRVRSKVYSQKQP